jgi:hypothetical protein
MGRNGVLILVAAVLIAIGGYFFFMGETAENDTATTTTAEPAVPPAPSAVGDTAVPQGIPAPAPETPPTQDLVPSNE